MPGLDPRSRCKRWCRAATFPSPPLGAERLGEVGREARCGVENGGHDTPRVELKNAGKPEQPELPSTSLAGVFQSPADQPRLFLLPSEDAFWRSPWPCRVSATNFQI